MRKPPVTARLGRAIRAQRERLELSQEALADQANLHRTYVGSVERGERNITILNLVRIAEALGVRASAILAAAEE